MPGRGRGQLLEVDVGRRAAPCACGPRRISTRPLWSGGWTMIWRSKRPGRSSAGSRTSGRLVAASTTTPSWPEKPSISVRIWFSVCSRSSWPPIDRAPPRARPMVSISSMKMIAGATLRASANSSRTRLAPTPTIISMNSEALALKNGTLASPAVARASSVLPVPGAPGEQHALRRARAEAAVLLRVLQEVDDLVDLGLDLVDAGDVVERDAHRLGIDALLRAAAEQSAAHRALLALEHPDVEADEQEDRRERDQQVGEEAALLDERRRAHRGPAVRSAPPAGRRSRRSAARS